MTTKTCSKCGQDKPADDFPWRNKSKGKRVGRCSPCYYAEQAAYRQAEGKYWQPGQLDLQGRVNQLLRSRWPLIARGEQSRQNIV